MKNWLKKLPRKWLILVVIAGLLLFSGVAYGANEIIVHFTGGIGVTGTITVIAPPPIAEDIVVLSTPSFTINAGDSNAVSGEIIVQNNSSYALTLTNATFVISTGGDLGVFHCYPWFVPVLPAHGQHSIQVEFNLNPVTTGGVFNYSGDLTYIW